MSSQRRFAVGLSYPSEKRSYVKAVADHLAQSLGEERILFDGYLEHELARPRADVYLGQLYRDATDLIVPFLCADYEKPWCGLEWSYIRSLIMSVGTERVMFVRLDATEIPGFLSVDAALWAADREPREIASLILKRLSVRPPPVPFARRVIDTLNHPRVIGAIGAMLVLWVTALASVPQGTSGSIGSAQIAAVAFTYLFVAVAGASVAVKVNRKLRSRSALLASGAITAVVLKFVLGTLVQSWLSS